MAVALQMVLVGVVAFLIQIAGIPVTTLASSLRSEVYPYAELRLAQPFRGARVVLLDTFPRRLERSVANGNIKLYLTKRIDVTQGHAAIWLRTIHLRNGGYCRQVTACLFGVLRTCCRCNNQHDVSNQ